MNRPSWNEYFRDLVELTATRSSCSKLHVGCILVRDNRIVSQGYNGFLTGCAHTSYKRNNHEVATVHAEQNAIVDCAKRGVSCNECIAYITHYPCLNCAKILLSAGIEKIFYINDYHNDILVETMCEEMNCKIQQLPKKLPSPTIQYGYGQSH
jgi:dCMP deaminase